MRCPYCNSTESKVVDKRETEDSFATRRRRECLECKKRYTTYERNEQVELIVIKKDGRRESFDRAKLEKGIRNACEKRPISYDEIKRIMNEIESALRNEDSIEIPSKHIGMLVMERLQSLDKIAYIRFASVYKEFKDIDSFHKEIEKIAKDGDRNG